MFLSLFAFILLTAVAMLYHPRRPIVIEMDGSVQNVEAVFTVDGVAHTKSLKLPALVNFQSAREFRWVLRQTNQNALSNQSTWHVRVTATSPIGNKEFDYEFGSQTGGTSGVIVCPNLLGLFFTCRASGDPGPG